MNIHDQYLSGEFGHAGGFEKIRTRVIQKQELRKRERAAYKSYLSPILPATLEIGDFLLCRTHLAEGSFTDSARHGTRPVYVYGIYYKRNRVVAVDLIGGTSQLSKGRQYPCEFVIETQTLMERTASDKPCLIRPAHIITVPNKSEFFASQKLVLGKLDRDLWPDLLVRRAEAIHFSPAQEYRNICPDITRDPDVVRKGFAFSAIPDYAVRCGQIMPDMMSNGLTHQETDILPNATVDLLARWSNSYSQHKRSSGKRLFAFPPMDGALESYPEQPFRDWGALERLRQNYAIRSRPA